MGSRQTAEIKVTSYAGNGGTRSYHPNSGFLMADGIFFQVGPNSKPQPNQQPVRLADVTDGTSNTLFFGERSRWDPNYNTFAVPQGWDWALRNYGNWCGTSRLGAVARNALEAYAPLSTTGCLSTTTTGPGRARPPTCAADFKCPTLTSASVLTGATIRGAGSYSGAVRRFRPLCLGVNSSDRVASVEHTAGRGSGGGAMNVRLAVCRFSPCRTDCQRAPDGPPSS